MKVNGGRRGQMKAEEGKWRQLKEIECRCTKMNGNEGIWRNMKAYAYEDQ